jgi:hypothetical protein
MTIALNLTFSPRKRNSQHAFLFFGNRPPHPVTGISKNAGNVEALSCPSPIGWERVAAGRVKV